MKISIGSDHRGHEQRQTLTEILESLGHQVDDCGSFGEESADYPDVAEIVCKHVVDGESDRGILVCGTKSLRLGWKPSSKAVGISDVWTRSLG